MIPYLFKRLLWMVPTLFGITVITFFVLRLTPGDPASLKLDLQSRGALAGDVSQMVAETRALYGLNRPLWIQYLLWAKRVATLDFGVSLKDRRPVLAKIAETLPVTLTLNILTVFLIYLISIPWGIATALRPFGWFDRLSSLFLFVLYSLPSFWVAMLLLTFASGGDYLNWFPMGGWMSDGAEQLPFWNRMGNIAWHLVLPVICLTYGGFAFLTRFSRASFLEVVHEDYMRTARAKGLSEWKVVWKHGLRNALIPQITLLGTLLPALLGGSVIVEQIFSIPGMGRLGFEAVLGRDYPTLMAIATLDAVLTLAGVLLADLLYKAVDPRIDFGAK